MEQSPDHLGVEKPWLLLLQQLDVWKDGSMYLEWGTVRDHPYCTRFHPRAQECTCFLKMIRTITVLLRPRHYVAAFFAPRSATERNGYIWKENGGFGCWLPSLLWSCCLDVWPLLPLAMRDCFLESCCCLPSIRRIRRWQALLREETFRKCGDFQPRMPFCFYLARGAFLTWEIRPFGDMRQSIWWSEWLPCWFVEKYIYKRKGENKRRTGKRFSENRRKLSATPCKQNSTPADVHFGFISKEMTFYFKCHFLNAVFLFISR